LIGGLLLLAGCSSSSHTRSPLVRGLENPDIRSDCEHAARKCTQCHPVERIINAGVDSPKHWQRYIGRMRLMPGSNIDSRDTKRIERCLVYRSFGDEGLAAIKRGEAP